MKKVFLSTIIFLIFIINLSSQNETIQLSTDSLITKTQLSQIINFKSENCRIFSFNIILAPSTKSDNQEKVMITEIINQGNELHERTINLLKTAKNGDKIYIEKIKSLGDCIEFQFRYTNFVVDVI